MLGDGYLPSSHKACEAIKDEPRYSCGLAIQILANARVESRPLFKLPTAHSCENQPDAKP